MDRRNFLKGSLATAASLGTVVSSIDRSKADAAREFTVRQAAPQTEIVDTNVYLFRWPFRRIAYDDPAALVEMLRSHGVVEAWAGSFEGVFHKDIAAVNARLADACRAYRDGMLVPIGSVNPKLTNWRVDMQRIDEEHGMPGIRLHPGYHNYTLEDSVVSDVLEEAAKRELVVQVVPWMQDERHHNPLMPVPTPETAPLAELADRFPELTLMVLNGFRSGGQLGPLVDTDNVLFDFAKLDVITPLDGYLENVPVERIVFGSYSPMFYFESATLKLQESVLSDEQLSAITHQNARRIRAS